VSLKIIIRPVILENDGVAAFEDITQVAMGSLGIRVDFIIVKIMFFQPVYYKVSTFIGNEQD
jgi:hypothetical protein